MPYEQQGNSCGAWCAAHRVAIVNTGIMKDAAAFTSAGRFIYRQVQFNASNVGVGWNAAQRTKFYNWCTNQYSDPWEIVGYLQRRGFAPQLFAAPAALAAGGDLGVMMSILQTVVNRGGRVIHNGAIAGIAANRYVIGVCFDIAQGGLHYLLMHRRNQFRVYDPRSYELNWRNLPAAPAFGNNISTTIMNPGMARQTYRFLGVYIAC